MSNYDECDAEASKLLYLYLNGGEPGGVSIHKRIAALLRAERSDPNEWVDPPRTLPAPPPPPQWVFVPTGEVRVPKHGEWHLIVDAIVKAGGVSYHSEQSVPIYRRVSVEELKCPQHWAATDCVGPVPFGHYRTGWTALLAKLGIKP